MHHRRNKKRIWTAVPHDKCGFIQPCLRAGVADSQTSPLIFDLPFLPRQILGIVEEFLGSQKDTEGESCESELSEDFRPYDEESEFSDVSYSAFE